MVKIVWTELAIEDQRSIHEYISKDSSLRPTVKARLGPSRYILYTLQGLVPRISKIISSHYPGVQGQGRGGLEPAHRIYSGH
jgi:hypothetical protein